MNALRFGRTWVWPRGGAGCAAQVAATHESCDILDGYTLPVACHARQEALVQHQSLSGSTLLLQCRYRTPCQIFLIFRRLL